MEYSHAGKKHHSNLPPGADADGAEILVRSGPFDNLILGAFGTGGCGTKFFKFGK
jgi:hypothetical protein